MAYCTQRTGRAPMVFDKIHQDAARGGSTLPCIDPPHQGRNNETRPLHRFTIDRRRLRRRLADLPSPGYSDAPPRAGRDEYGVVEHIDLYREGSGSPTGLGAVLGGIAGGVIGHQFGSSRGNTVPGRSRALGGACGQRDQRSSQKDRYRVTVRLDGGAPARARGSGRRRTARRRSREGRERPRFPRVRRRAGPWKASGATATSPAPIIVADPAARWRSSPSW